MSTINKLGIDKQIDKLISMTKGAKATMGQRASAIILNGLGFIDDRLYLFPKFLENKPVAKLLGENLQASNFNDDTLGRFLDKVHAYGETKLFSEISLPIALKHKLITVLILIQLAYLCMEIMILMKKTQQLITGL